MIAVGDLVAAASVITAFSEEDIRGRSKFRPLSRVRQAIYMIAKQEGHSYPEIGRRMGGRDHATIIHGVRTGEAAYERMPSFRGLIREIRAVAEKRIEARVKHVEFLLGNSTVSNTKR